MAASVALYKFSEAASGTGPTTVSDSDASPVDLAITYAGAGAWTSNAAGDGLTCVSGTRCAGTVSGTKIATAVSGQTQWALEGVFSFPFSSGGEPFGIFASQPTYPFVAYVNGSTLELYSTSFGGSAAVAVSWNMAGVAAGDHVLHIDFDSTQASLPNRIKLFLDGRYIGNTVGTQVTQNSTVTVASGDQLRLGQVESGTPSGSTIYFYAIYNSLSDPEALSHALRLFASNDNDPNLAGASLCAADGNGGTSDTSVNTGDHTISFTVAIAGSGLGRKVQIPIAYMGVTSGVTAITFNGSASGVHLSAQQQSSLATLAGCDVYEILDADLPGAGTYTISVTVDGAVGVACGTPVYLEGVSQSYATNIGLATGTGTSITATLPSSVAAGSILTGQMLNVSFGDDPVSGSKQLRLVSQASSSVIQQIVGAKYVYSSGSNSMSWSGLTGGTGKIAIAIESAVPSSGATPDTAVFLGNPTLLM